MTHRTPSARAHLALLLLIAAWLGAAAVAGDGGPNTTIPAEKDPNRHQEFLAIAKAGGVDLLFLGDSITDGWRGGGQNVWNKYWAPFKAANFGIGGDQVQHVLWRLRHGELEGIQPKLIVMMIGTNNGGDSVDDVALGIKTLLVEIHKDSPKSKVLLLGIFPRSEHPDGAREKNDNVNKQIAKFATFAEGRRIVYLDIGSKFLAADGTLPKDIMPDSLHPNEKGYQIWAEATIDTVKQMMQDEPMKPVPSFSPPATVPRVAKLEDTIINGKVGIGTKALEKLAEDKDAKTADAAKASLATVQTWKAQVDAELAKLKDAGDVFIAGELAASLAAGYAGSDEGKAYQEQATAMKKDPAFPAGKEFQKLNEFPAEARRDPRFAKMVEAFVKKYPAGYYAQQAQALLPSK
jgi:lysophospholipase L1-like esterase